MPINSEDALAVQRLLAQGRALEAELLARDAVKNSPEDANAWFLMAGVMRATEQHADAMAAIQRALLIQPFHPGYHTLQAELYLDAGHSTQGEVSLRRALDAKRDFLPALSLLGILLMDANRVDEALPFLQQCATLRPDSAQHINNLGACYLKAGRDADAERTFAHAVQQDTDYFTARYNLVRVLIKRGADEAAVPHLQVLLSQQPDHQDSLFLVGNLCQRNGDFATATEYLKRAAEQKPVKPAALNALAELCWDQGDTVTAINLYDISAQTEPANIRAALGRHLALPMVCESASAVGAARQRFTQGLRNVQMELPTLRQRTPAMLLQEVQWTNFLLAYQGENDLALQREYAALVTELMQAALSQFVDPRPSRREGKARIGFISNHFYSSAVGHYFESWVTGLPKGTYDVHVYNGSRNHDELSRRIAAGAHKVNIIYGMGLAQIAELVAADDLDVLIYLEMGMHPQLFPLGALRLARVQVAAWGHPVTTGFANIDYFLSCADMEPADAASHYSEKLHLLPGLGTCYQAPAFEGPVAERAALQLPETGALYLVPQSLYKIHPDNDAILAEVLKRDPTGTLVMFVTERHKVAITVFVKRLQAALVQAGVAPAGRVRMLPQVSHEQYLAINRLCDVMIDTVRWSGGNTTLDALAVGLPVVTTEGRYMRGRQSAAMLRMIGLGDLVTDSPATLVSRAIDIATTPGLKADIRARAHAGRMSLFEQQAPIAALDQFLSSLT